MFLQDSDIIARLAAVLKQDVDALDPYWTATLVPIHHPQAYQEIVTQLSSRGFSLAQITAWDRGAEFEASITLFWLLVEGGGLHDYSDAAINKMDRRKELATVLITVAGTEIVPALGSMGTTIGSGALNENMQGLQFRYGVGNGTSPPFVQPAPFPWGRQIW